MENMYGIQKRMKRMKCDVAVSRAVQASTYKAATLQHQRTPKLRQPQGA